MKALWLKEVKALLESDDFDQWWKTLLKLDGELSAVKDRHEELLAQANLTGFRAELTQKTAIDTLYKAGELEDAAALSLAESAEVENKAYEAVANFESQRIAVSELYSKMGAVEHHFLEVQAEMEELQKALSDADNDESRKEISRHLKRKQETLSDREKHLKDASSIYERGHERKMRLWEEVEQMWARSLDISLTMAEQRAKSRRARQTAERLFKEAEQHKQSAADLSTESEQAAVKMEEIHRQIDQHRKEAKRSFGCIVGEEFLYWPRRENNKEVYCMPILDYSSGFNLELEGRSLYLVTRQRGVEFIEPLPPEGGIVDSDDHRLDDFFMKPDKKTSPGADKEN